MVRRTLLVLAILLSTSVKAEHLTNAVLGDVEGDWKLFSSFFKNNPAFETGKNLELKDGFRFVYLGDTMDKGPASRRIIQTLLELKNRYPRRVILVLGNRDINKLRLLFELERQELKEPPKNFLEWLEQNEIPASFKSDPVTRLKWIFEKTMGAKEAFQFRREELKDGETDEVTDREVLQSIVNDIRNPRGLIARYILQGQIIFYDRENRALFVHGAILPENFLKTPEKAKSKTVQKWTETLNAWARDQIHKAIWRGDHPTSLIQYQEPVQGTRKNSESVVYGRYSDETGNPKFPSKAFAQSLAQNGVQNVLVGHTPSGDIPVVLTEGDVRVAILDHSHGKFRKAPIVLLKSSRLWVRAPSPVKGFGTEVRYVHKIGSRSPIGKQRKGARVVGTNESGALLLFKVLPGFKVEYQSAQ